MKMNIVKKVFCFYYLVNKGKCNNRTDSIGLSFGGIGAVMIMNIWFILEILKKMFGINPYISKTLIFGGIIFIYSVLAIYFFLFKNYKIVDEVQQYSPWKRPVIWGGIYIILSIVFIFVPIFIPR